VSRPACVEHDDDPLLRKMRENERVYLLAHAIDQVYHIFEKKESA
jgi:hypothetical protein